MAKKNLFKSICAALAAAFFCLAAAGFSPSRLPRGCTVGGVDVSGKTLAAAAASVNDALARELQEKSLTVYAGESTYVFRAPELYFVTDLRQVLCAALGGRGGDYPLQKRLCLLNEERAVRGICADLYRRSENVRTLFDPQADTPLQFTAEVSGRCVNGAKLRADIRETLAAGDGAVVADVHVSRPPVTRERAEADASLLARFTTYFNAAAHNRAHNISVAAQKICCTVGAGEIFSFNTLAGARTAENGYLPAPVILSGEFVEGVGGGVCQVSTTVYNAALLAGMQIVEYHAHSLAVGYVAPSFDAMVSGSGCDLRFRNATGARAYLVCRVRGNALTVSVYGRSTGAEYERESVLVQYVDPPEPEIRESGEITEEREIRVPKQGIRSEGYLIVRRGGKTERKRLRKDSYAPVRGIVERPKAPQNAPSEPFGQNGNALS